MQRVIHCLAALAASAAGFAAESGRPSQWKGERLACMECHTRLTNEFRATGHGKAMEVHNSVLRAIIGEWQTGGALTWQVVWLARRLPEILPVSVGSEALLAHVRALVAADVAAR